MADQPIIQETNAQNGSKTQPAEQAKKTKQSFRLQDDKQGGLILPQAAAKMFVMAVDHYENFPVASLLLPRRLRPAVRAVYAFARTADDVADEGEADDQTRLARLDALGAHLAAMRAREPLADDVDRPLCETLAAAVREHDLSVDALADLLSAFRQDVRVKRYADFAAVLDYCRRSANPVGALMLQLYGAQNAQTLPLSDAICSALQLINFCQDVALDWARGRVYLPQDEMAQFGVEEAELAACVRGEKMSPALAALLAMQLERAQRMMIGGAPLARMVPGRMGWELRLVVCGGLRIVERIRAVEYDVFRRRPQLQLRDWPPILYHGVRYPFGSL